MLAKFGWIYIVYIPDHGISAGHGTWKEAARRGNDRHVARGRCSNDSVHRKRSAPLAPGGRC